MRQQLLRLFGSTALAAALALTAAAQEYSNGGKGQKGRGPATSSPVEAFGVHPPGPDPYEAQRGCFHRWACIFRPYYAPVSPIPTSIRWRPWCYFPLMPWYTPYYCGYCPKRCHNPPPRPYGWDGGWGQGPMPGDAPCRFPLNYGPYSSVLKDDTIFWNMGGNGLVPYGTPRPPHGGPTDLVDMIQSSRPGGGLCPTSFNGAPVAQGISEAGPAIQPPTEKQDETQPDRGTKGTRGTRGTGESKGPPVEEDPASPE